VTYRVGYFVGSLSKESINRVLANALISVAPEDLEFFEIGIADLPLYNRDLDAKGEFRVSRNATLIRGVAVSISPPSTQPQASGAIPKTCASGRSSINT